METIFNFIGKAFITVAIAVAGIFGGTPALNDNVGATIPIPVAVFQTSLASSITSSATSMTLVAGTDKSGDALSGYICFNIDEGTALEEFVCGTASGTAISSMLRGIDPIDGDLEVTALKKAHRRGASVKVTNYPSLGILSRILNGDETIPNAIKYASGVAPATADDLADKGYVDGVAIAGAPDSSTTTKGIVKMSTAPASATEPIAVGDNDTRVPTQDENNALVGTSGTATSTSNKLVDAADVSDAGVSGKIVRATGTALPALSGANLTGLGLASADSYTFGETITAGQPVYLKASDNKVYKASASAADELLWNYIGIAAEGGSADQVKKVYTKEGTVVTIADLGATTTATASTKIVEQTGATADQITNLYTGGATPGTVFVTGPTQGNITTINITFSSKTGSGGGNVTLTLYEVTGYDSTTTVTSTSVGSKAVTAPSNFDGGTVAFTFASPITVKPNTHYNMVLSADGGSGANMWNLPDNNGVISASFMASSSSTAVTTNGGAANGKVMVFDVYSTLTSNYTVGDYIYLGNTAGSLSFVGGTKHRPLGRILSSTTMLLGVPQNRTLIKTVIVPSGTTLAAAIPIPKNALEADWQSSGTSTVTKYGTFNFKIGQLTSKTHTVGDVNGASNLGFTATQTFGGSGLSTLVNNVLTSCSTTIYYYK